MMIKNRFSLLSAIVRRVVPHLLPHLVPSLLLSFALSLAANPARAQLVTGIEAGTSAYRSSQQTSAQVFNRDSGTLVGFKTYFGAQRNWENPGWIVGLDYQGGTISHQAQSLLGVTVGSQSKVHLIHLSAKLHVPLTEIAGFSIAAAPRLSYRAQGRSVIANPFVSAIKEDLSEGAMAVGLSAHTLVNQFGFKASFEVERSFLSHLNAQFSPAYSEAIFKPSGVWRPQLDIAGWYQWTPRHRFTLQARFDDLSTARSEPVAVGPTTGVGPSITALSPGQKVRTSTLNAGWSYHF